MTHHHRHHRRHHHQMAFPPATCLKTTMSTERLRVQNPARFKVKHDRRERHSGFSMRSLLFIFAGELTLLLWIWSMMMMMVVLVMMMTT